jgi:hypothetical protein
LNPPDQNAMRERLRRGIVLGLAILSFLAPLKFTQIVMLSSLTPRPTGWAGWAFGLWPDGIFYGVLILLVALRLAMWQRPSLTVCVWIGPVLFVAVQGLSTLLSSDPALSWGVLQSFLGLAVGYWLAAETIRDECDLEWVTFGWLAAGALVAASGIFQVTGGLEPVRQLVRANPQLVASHPGLGGWAKSHQIFATFVYPSALGGYAISALFVIAAWYRCFGDSDSRRRAVDSSAAGGGMDWLLPILIAGAVALALLYCLWKTGSKGSCGILFVVLAGGVAWWFGRRSWKSMMIGILALVLAGAIGWGLVSSLDGRFKMAVVQQSVAGRLKIWRAAAEISWDHPLFGSGPGTFASRYPRYRRTGDEPTILVHNNYLQMASDSGLAGFAAFILWLPGTLWLAWRRWRNVAVPSCIVPLLIGCAGLCFALRSLGDFDLYMTGNAWPIFVLLGYLAAAKPPVKNCSRDLPIADGATGPRSGDRGYKTGKVPTRN